MVFSGIVEEVGVVKQVKNEKNMKMWDGSIAEGYVFRIESHVVMKNECYIGVSI